MFSTSANLNLMINTVKKAGGAISRDFSEIEKLQISKKGVSDFVTNADFKSEKIIINELSRARPQYSFLLEESGEINNSDEKDDISYRWIVDPIDGTFNFMHGNPFFCISIGLEKRFGGNSEIIAGVVYAPIFNEIYFAEKGKGAFQIDYMGNQTRMRVSSRNCFNSALCATCDIYGSENSTHNKLIQKILKQKGKLRVFGSAILDMVFVACGKCEVFFQHSLKPWDVATGLILVREAGGIITNYKNDTASTLDSDLIVSNEALYSKIIKEVQ